MPASFLAVLGAVSLSVGGMPAAISLKGAGSSWVAAVLLVLSRFRVAAGRLLWERARQAKVSIHDDTSGVRHWRDEAARVKRDG